MCSAETFLHPFANLTSMDNSSNVTLPSTLRHDPYDFVNITFMCVVFVISAPLNVSVLRCLAKQLRTGRQTRAQYLQLHLFISDLFLILFYIPCYIVWSITIEFFGSDISCKVTKFITAFQFYLSTNMVVCISLDRILQVTLLDDPSRRFQKITVGGAYLAAVLFSLPQFYFWRVELVMGQYQHCSDVSSMAELSEIPHWHEYFYLYSLGHLMAVFWIPLTIILFAYMCLLVQIHRRNDGTFGRSPTTWSSNSQIYRMTIVNKLSSQSQESREFVAIARRRYVSENHPPMRQNHAYRNRLFEVPCGRVLAPTDSNCRRTAAQHRVTSKAAKTASLLVLAFVLFRFPFNLIDLLLLLGKLDYTAEVVKTSSSLYVWSVLTSVVNPFIYHRINAPINRHLRNWRHCGKMFC